MQRSSGGRVGRRAPSYAAGAARSLAKDLSSGELLIAAVARQDQESAEQILHSAADPRAVARYADSRGRTPLHVATSVGSLRLVDLLLSFGADVSAQDVNGNSALHLACTATRPAIVSRLLRAGSRADVRDRFSATPRDVAVARLRMLSVATAEATREAVQRDVDVVLEMLLAWKEARSTRGTVEAQTDDLIAQLQGISMEEGTIDDLKRKLGTLAFDL